MQQKKSTDEALVVVLERAAREEQWEVVDENLSKLDGSYSLEWAVRNFGSEDTNVRDLAYSMIQKLKIEKNYFSKIRNKIAAGMVRDEKNYAGFRAACALAEHGVGKYPKNVKRVLENFSQDTEVGEIARGYLARLTA